MKWYPISVHAFKKWNYQMEKSFGTPNINCHSDKENPLIDLKKKRVQNKYTTLKNKRCCKSSSSTWIVVHC